MMRVTDDDDGDDNDDDDDNEDDEDNDDDADEGMSIIMAVGVSGPPRGNSGKRETGKSDNGPGEARGDGETEVAKSNRLFYG